MTNPEVRWNPLTKEYVIYSPKRQSRPDRDEVKCPFCEGSEEVPIFEKIMRLPNKFPSLSQDLECQRYKVNDFHEKITGYGKCEVVVYTKNHEGKFSDLSNGEILSIFENWIQATKEISSDQHIKYILPFENYGKDVGASLHHPHGQIYAFPFIPSDVKKELESLAEYQSEKKSCLICDILKQELLERDRVVIENDYIVAIVPFYAKYSYDLYIYPKRHHSFLHQSTRRELEAYVEFVPQAIKALNSILKQEVSYSLSLHQQAVNSKGSSNFHFYFKLHTPQRNSKSLKLLGAVETATNVFINGTLPEDAAKQYRQELN